MRATSNLLIVLFILLFLALSQSALSEDNRRIIRFRCPETVRINRTKFPWNKHDDDELEWVKKNNRCSFQEPGNPCVIRFFKTGEQDYYVECGPKRRA